MEGEKMNYQNLFNKQYNEDMKIKQLYREQQQEFEKMLKALNDFMDSAIKIAPQYQQQAFENCVNAICGRLLGNNK